jgi:ABC-2 type transport system ATP-binding protein
MDPRSATTEARAPEKRSRSAIASLPSAPGEHALTVQHLSKRFGERVAFEDISFEVGYGEVFGFLGPNGAGKTPESPGLYQRLTVGENLRCFAGLYELDDVSGRIDRALRAVNVQDRANDPCGSLSKDLRQRVALARALLNDPAVLFLDEPTSGLDPVAAHDVHELIVSLRERGVTIFLTTHRLAEAERLCHRVAIMSRTLRLVGTPDELRAQLFSETLEVHVLAPLVDPGATFAGLPGVDGWAASGSGGYTLAVSDPHTAAPAVARALVSAGADILSLSESRHSLEDVYLELINEDVEAQRP